MKTFLLAAGLGSRLRPLTDQVPKCLVRIAGKPILQIWLELLARHGVREVLINTHHLSEQVYDFAANWSGHPKLHLSHEVNLLGSAGTLERNWDFVAAEESFLVCYADNLTNMDLGSLVQFHQTHPGSMTMALFLSERPEECGVAEMDEKGLITSFEEKPTAPRSALANAGVYVMRARVHSLLPRIKPSDIGFDLLPRCLGDMYGWRWDGLLKDIGNPLAYAQAQSLWAGKPAAPARPNGSSTGLTFSGFPCLDHPS